MYQEKMQLRRDAVRLFYCYCKHPQRKHNVDLNTPFRIQRCLLGDPHELYLPNKYINGMIQESDQVWNQYLDRISSVWEFFPKDLWQLIVFYVKPEQPLVREERRYLKQTGLEHFVLNWLLWYLNIDDFTQEKNLSTREIILILDYHFQDCNFVQVDGYIPFYIPSSTTDQQMFGTLKMLCNRKEFYVTKTKETPTTLSYAGPSKTSKSILFYTKMDKLLTDALSIY